MKGDFIVKNFLEIEANNLNTILIAVHGFSSSRNSFVFQKIAPTLKENNIGLVCFDLPGHGLRKNEKLNVKACLDSIKEIEEWVKSFYSGSISLTGASFGGFLLLRYLENNTNQYGKKHTTCTRIYVKFHCVTSNQEHHSKKSTKTA